MEEDQNLLLSIIVPVYNVEGYIRPCIESIFLQGLDEDCFEVIIVNDGTKDHSMEVIQDIIEQHKNITVLNQENQGLSVARNNGIAMAKGEYILMPDSDDLLIEKSLKPLLEKAIEYESDLVVADFLSLIDDEIELLKMQPIKQNTILTCIEKTGEQLLLEDLNPNQCYVWRTLFKKDFLIKNNIKFVPGIYIQDVPFIHECYIKARKCLRVSWLLNIYRRGHESATFSFNKKKELDFCTAIAKTWELMNIEGLSPNIQGKLREDMYISFSMVIWILIHRIEKASDRIEIIDYLRSQTPDLCFTNGIKQKLVSFLYRHLPHTFIRIRFLYDHWLRRPF
jgi:glycosyltransferase involved in cell wall biosynthesis